MDKSTTISNKDTEYLKTSEVADIYRVTVETIREWRDRGMPHWRMSERVFRYDADEVKAWVDMHRIYGE